MENLTEDERHAIDIVGSVLPFRVNNFVVEELIDWNKVPNDPIFQLTFPQKEMLATEHFNMVHQAIDSSSSKLAHVVESIRKQLNPNPAGQMEFNLPFMDGSEIKGIQHKYDDTVLFFPSHGQTCHAYCTFCFRWPQFIGDVNLKFQAKESEVLVKYLKSHPNVTDVLITGGDPMIMNYENLEAYLTPLLDESVLPHLNTIRLGTKALSYWPYKFTSDPHADKLLRLFEKIVKSGKHLAFMAHVNHPVELKPKIVQEAIGRILSTGAQIRTQAPIMKHINDSALVWQELWNLQVRLGCIPYYMFIARDTGAQNYFGVSLVDALNIFRTSYQNVSGLARTVRGPCMSTTPGKIQIVDTIDVHGESILLLKFLRARKKEWVNKVFLAKYNDSAIWVDDLAPANGSDWPFNRQDFLKKV
jgi:KamA family protein